MSNVIKASSLEEFAVKFIAGKTRWNAIPRKNAIINFGNIISFLLYREPPFQVELFICPFEKSSFTEHVHPNVDVFEYGLTGCIDLHVQGDNGHTDEQFTLWQDNLLDTPLVRIKPGVFHSGEGHSCYAFLSIQKWKDGIEMTSVGLDWIGKASSSEQADMLFQQMLA